MGALGNKFKEVFTSTMPVIIVVFMMQMFLTKSTYTDYMLFWGFSVFVLAGLTFFLHGVDMGVNPVGNAIGSEIPKRKSRLFMILVIFAISFLVTVAEPNVSIFGQQVMDIYPSVSRHSLRTADSGHQDRLRPPSEIHIPPGLGCHNHHRLHSS